MKKFLLNVKRKSSKTYGFLRQMSFINGSRGEWDCHHELTVFKEDAYEYNNEEVAQLSANVLKAMFPETIEDIQVIERDLKETIPASETSAGKEDQLSMTGLESHD